jgi:hypothetical protein
MPRYRATLGVTAEAFFTTDFVAPDETTAIDRVLIDLRARHDSPALTIVEQSERGWRIDDLLLLDAEGKEDWDNGLICEDIPLDRRALELQLGLHAPALLALLSQVLAELGPRWSSRLAPTTVNDVVGVLARIERRPLEPEAVLPAITATLNRIDQAPNTPAGCLPQFA